MRKVLAVVWWAWIPLCWYPLWGQAPGVGVESGRDRKQHAPLSTNRAKNAGQDQKGTHESPLVVEVETHNRPRTKEEADNDKAENDRKHNIDSRTVDLTFDVALFTGLLVLVGLGGVIAALLTLRVIGRQTDALINGQRGWILVDNVGEPPLYDGIERPEVMAAMAGTPLLVFNLKTVGSTPVKLINGGARFHLQARKDGVAAIEPALPDEPVYKIGPASSNQLPQPEIVRGPNEKFQIPVVLEDGPLSEKQFGDVRARQLFVCAYGFITYEDAFGRKRETRFCYIYRSSSMNWIDSTGKNVFPSKFVVDGPQAYNRYT